MRTTTIISKLNPIQYILKCHIIRENTWSALSSCNSLTWSLPLPKLRGLWCSLNWWLIFPRLMMISWSLIYCWMARCFSSTPLIHGMDIFLCISRPICFHLTCPNMSAKVFSMKQSNISLWETPSATMGLILFYVDDSPMKRTSLF